MITIYNQDGTPQSKSQNLRGVITKNNHPLTPCNHVSVSEVAGGGAWVVFVWPNGSYAETDFASFKIACDFANHRRFSYATKSILPKV